MNKEHNKADYNAAQEKHEADQTFKVGVLPTPVFMFLKIWIQVVNESRDLSIGSRFKQIWRTHTLLVAAEELKDSRVTWRRAE